MWCCAGSVRTGRGDWKNWTGHRTLKQDLQLGRDWRAQQHQLDQFRQDYNQVRPHEALGMHPPASVYEPSPRPYPNRVPEVEYPDTMQVLKVKSHGHFRWKKQDVFLSEVLWGEPIGLLPIDDQSFKLYFAHLPLALFNHRLLRITPLCENKNKSKSKDKSPSEQGEKQKLSGMCPV